MSFFDGPILNSPYHHPGRYWELDEEGQPSDQILSRRRPSALWTALPGRSAKSTKTQKSLVFDDSDLSTEATEFNPSPIVNNLRQELDIWRALPNPSQWKVATDKTRAFLSRAESTVFVQHIITMGFVLTDHPQSGRNCRLLRLQHGLTRASAMRR